MCPCRAVILLLLKRCVLLGLLLFLLQLQLQRPTGQKGLLGKKGLCGTWQCTPWATGRLAGHKREGWI